MHITRKSEISISNESIHQSLFQSYMHDIGNLRSHHWKHWIDVYENCAYDCKYCVYRAGGRMGKIKPLVEKIELLREDLTSLRNPGIVYLGPKADVYQPAEKRLGKTRLILEAFHDFDIPTFIVTRSDLMMRDLDILSDMAIKGLIEISISIASPQILPTLEPNSPTVSQRLALLSELRRHGIPASVHMSPIIPHLDTVESIKALMSRISDAGASCIYACVLGMADRYFDIVKRALPVNISGELVEHVYARGNRHLDIYSADQDYIVRMMRELSDSAAKHAIPFACVHIPEFDTVERTGHIFRYKLPNVGDFVRYFNRKGATTVHFEDVALYLDGFSAVDRGFFDTVRMFWDEGVIFKNTYFHRAYVAGEVVYQRRDTLDLLVTNMRVGQCAVAVGA